MQFSYLLRKSYNGIANAGLRLYLFSIKVFQLYFKLTGRCLHNVKLLAKQQRDSLHLSILQQCSILRDAQNKFKKPLTILMLCRSNKFLVNLHLHNC